MQFLSFVLDLFLLLVLVCIYPVVWLIRTIFYQREIGDIPSKPIVITGCDSGFGRLACVLLARRGAPIFASCLKSESIQELQDEGLSTLHPFQMDIRDQESVEKGRSFVDKATQRKGIWALINNAGVSGPIGHAEWIRTEAYTQVYQVNTLGAIATTKAFIPLIKRMQGRIVTTVSMVGWVEAMDTSPYVMSKFALNGFVRCLRHEMAQYGVKVISVCPGAYLTDINKGVADSLTASYNAAPQEILDQYKDDYIGNKGRSVENLYYKQLMAGNQHSQVTDAYQSAVFAQWPKLSYFPDLESRLGRLIGSLPEETSLLHSWITRKFTTFPPDPDYENVPLSFIL